MSRVINVLAKLTELRNSVPEELKKYPGFFLVFMPGKIPCDHRPGNNQWNCFPKGDAQNKPENHLSFEDALKAAEQALNAGKDILLAFWFSKRQPIFGVDVDDCVNLETGKWTELGVDIYNRFPGAAFEYSNSGDGFHLYGMYRPDDLPEHIKNRKAGPPVGTELFITSQYLVFTGNGKQGTAFIDFTEQLIRYHDDYFPHAGSNQDTVEDTRTVSSSIVLDDDYKRRLTAYTEFKMGNQSGHLATLPEGRRQALNAAVYALAPYVNHSDLSLEIVREDLWNACQKNGITKKPGKPMTRKEFETIFNTAYNDAITKNPDVPVLKERRKTPQEYFANAPANQLPVGASLTPLNEPKPAPEDIQPPLINIEPKNPYLTMGESDVAKQFVDTYESKLRFVAEWGRWMVYENGYWRNEKSGYAYNCISQLVTPSINQCSDALNKSDIKHLKSGSYRSGILKIASSDRKVAAVSEQFDNNDFLLNTPNETIDLRTGNTRPHNPDDYITNQTTVGLSNRQPVKWLHFLSDITRGDIELMNYLQRVAGYCLTGSTREHDMFFLYGSGRNGKGVFMDTLAYLLNTYEKAASSETFTAKKHETHPADLAYLRGARLVTASEIEPGKTWAESRIKQLTGEDTIAARFMRGDFFEFKPQCKILIAANNKPSISNVDPAIKSRIKIIPFLADFSARPNQNLREELIQEADAILFWCVQGAIAWQTQGLNTPQSVLNATNEYFESEDLEGQWIKNNIVRDFKAVSLLKDLYSDWRMFSADNHGRAKSQKELSERLQREGFEKKRMTKGYAFPGIRIRTQFDIVDDDNNVVQFPGR